MFLHKTHTVYSLSLAIVNPV